MKQHGGAIVEHDRRHVARHDTNMGHSGAARAGMLNFTETAALEWAPVRVTAIAPGWIASSGLDQYPPQMRKHIRALPAKVPAGAARPEIRNLRRDRVSALASRGVRVRYMPPDHGAAPNVKANYAVTPKGATEAFDGFHLAAKPKVLEVRAPSPTYRESETSLKHQLNLPLSRE